MEKISRSDIATFPELFGDVDQFVQEMSQGIKRTGIRLAMLAIPGSALAMFALSKAV